MRKSKKHPKDMTTDEIAQAVFPKKVHEKLKEIAHADEKGKSDDISRSQQE